VDNTVAAVGVAFSQATISESFLAGTRAGSFLDDNGDLHEDFGDGLTAALSADGTIERTIIERVARAGILFDQSSGAINSCESRENKYGVVLQGMPHPDFDVALSSLRDNQAEDFLSDGDLAIPSEAPGGP
jgi:hypothetical protein